MSFTLVSHCPPTSYARKLAAHITHTLSHVTFPLIPSQTPTPVRLPSSFNIYLYPRITAVRPSTSPSANVRFHSFLPAFEVHFSFIRSFSSLSPTFSKSHGTRPLDVDLEHSSVANVSVSYAPPSRTAFLALLFSPL